ncbi:MAG TPA: RDD family protein [bacterium]|nr:RDD family protein [bacterium]
MTKASFLARFGAVLIDGLLFWGVGFAIHFFWFGLLGIVYETVLLSNWNGQTIGKKIIGIRVVTTSGQGLDATKAFVRSAGKILSALPLYLGFFWALFDAQNQTWHDKIAETYVVQA